MSKCQKCGTEHEANFCPNCGTPAGQQPVQAGWNNVSSQPAPQQQKASGGGVHCPKCGGTNLQTITDVKGKGVSGTKVCLFGICGLCGAGKTKSTSYWVCQNCGHKFKI